MIDNVFINKCATIQRCLKRIDEEFQNNEQRLLDSYTIQDSVTLNLQRACEASIDLAMHLISQGKLGIPQSSRDSFKILADNKVISSKLSTDLQHMTGFRNLAVHDYQKLQIPILLSILNSKLRNFTDFIDELNKYRSNGHK